MSDLSDQAIEAHKATLEAGKSLADNALRQVVRESLKD